MITYVDTSALIKLFIDEPGSAEAAAVWEASDTVASATLVIVEARAALAAATRAGRLTVAQHRAAKRALAVRVSELALVRITDRLVETAAVLAEDESLRGYDAVHLAAALEIEAAVFLSADGALCDAAGRRGMHVADPTGD